MNEDIKTYFKHFLALEPEDLDLFTSKFELKHYKKGDYFIKEGATCSNIGLILKGCLICVYNNEGVDVIDEFSMENEFISDYKNFLDNQPAEKNVKCIEDTDLLVVSREDLNALYAKKQVFEKAGRIIAESLFKSWHQKAMSLKLDNAETRYLKLIKNKPTLLQRVPQYLIASYLNVTPESLSRIRKKINA